MYDEVSGNVDKSKLRLQIDQNLKRAYEGVLQEAVPARFEELLARLRAKEEGSAPAASPDVKPAGTPGGDAK